jgi:hypothetical protein
MSPRPFLALAAAAIVGSCGKSVAAPIACTEIAMAAVNVKVLDSVSSLGLPFSSLWARVRDGVYMDSSFVVQTLATDAPKTFGLAYERSGTYEVTVKAIGYKEWKRSNIVVARDECHVIPVLITARLQR